MLLLFASSQEYCRRMAGLKDIPFLWEAAVVQEGISFLWVIFINLSTKHLELVTFRKIGAD